MESPGGLFRTLPNVKVKQKSRSSQHTFYNVVKPLLYLLAALGKLPVMRNTNSGNFIFRLKSEAMLYAAVVYVLQVALVFSVYYTWITVLAAVASYDNVLFVSVLLIFLTDNFYPPFTYFKAAPKIVDYLNSWKQFEDEYHSVVGRPITLKLSRAALLSGPFVIAFMAAALAMLCSLVYKFSWIEVVVFYFTGCTSLCTLSIWVFNCIALAMIAADFSEQLVGELKENQTTQRLDQWRQLWLSLNNLTQQFASSMSRICLQVFLTFQITFVLACYGGISNLMDRGLTPYTVGVVLVTLFAASVIFVICYTGHQVAKKVRVQNI